MLPRGTGAEFSSFLPRVQGPSSHLIYQLGLSSSKCCSCSVLAFPISGCPRATLAHLPSPAGDPSPRLLQCSLMTPLLSHCSSEGLGLGLNSWRTLGTSQVLLCHTSGCGHGASLAAASPSVAGPFLRKPSSSVGGKQPAQRDSYRS